MSGPFQPPQGPPPTSPTPPAPYELPPGPSVAFSPKAPRNHGRIVLLIVLGTVVTALVTLIVVILPLTREARSQADAALDVLKELETPVPPGPDAEPTKPPRSGVVPVDPADPVDPLDPATPTDDPPLAVAVDGRYPLDTYVWFDGDLRVEGTPVNGWTVDPADPGLWTRGECRVVRTEGEVITFGEPDGTTTDRNWTVEDIGMNAFFLEDDVEAITARGESLELAIPTSDGNVLDALGQTYDLTDPSGRALEMVYAARALTWHDVTVQVMLICPAGTLTDPAVEMQSVLDGYVVVLP